MSPGLRPACSVPLAGPNSIQAMSPTSGSISFFPAMVVAFHAPRSSLPFRRLRNIASFQDVLQPNFTTRIGIIDDLGPDVRSPIDQFGLVLRTEPIHFGDQVFKPIMLDRQGLSYANVPTFDCHNDLGARFQSRCLNCGLRQSQAQTVSPFRNFDLHRSNTPDIQCISLARSCPPCELTSPRGRAKSPRCRC